MSVRFLKSVARKVLYLLATIVVLLTIAWWAAQPGKPDAFYSAPAQRPAEPGALLRIDAFTREIPAGTRGWRILYTTTRGDNSPALIDAKQVKDQRLVFAFARVKNGKLRRRSKLFIEIPACRSCFV
jgi:hypothetical protein